MSHECPFNFSLSRLAQETDELGRMRAYTDVAVNVSFVQGIVRRDILFQIPDSYRVIAGAGDETPGRHRAYRVWTSRIHLNAPDAGRMI